MLIHFDFGENDFILLTKFSFKYRPLNITIRSN